jgi:hypothetical protein
MKKSLFLYLFVFAILVNVFTYVYFSNQHKFDTQRVESMQAKLKTTKDSLVKVSDQLHDANYFSLENNENALEYFEDQDIALIQKNISNAIFKLNDKPEGNPLTGYPAMGDKPFSINKFKILNHRWIIADYTNGKVWGEAIIKYFVDSNGNITFETAETALHSNTLN